MSVPARAKIRPARRDDLPAIARIHHDSWHASHGPLSPPEMNAYRDRAFFNSRALAFWPKARVADLGDGRLAGFVVADPPQLSQLFIDPALRGQGYGAPLLAAGERDLAAAGCHAPYLKCRAGNDGAYRFYLRHGWVLDREIMDAVTTTAGPVLTPVRILTKAL